MLTRLVVALIRGPLLIFVSLSKVISLLVRVKHRMLSPVLVLMLNIELWLILLLRCYEFALSFMTWVLMFLILCRCVVTMRLLFLLPTILFSMSISNTSRLIVTLFKICWCNDRLSLPMPTKMNSHKNLCVFSATIFQVRHIWFVCFSLRGVLELLLLILYFSTCSLFYISIG